MVNEILVINDNKHDSLGLNPDLAYRYIRVQNTLCIALVPQLTHAEIAERANIANETGLVDDAGIITTETRNLILQLQRPEGSGDSVRIAAYHDETIKDFEALDAAISLAMCTSAQLIANYSGQPVYSAPPQGVGRWVEATE